MKSMFKFFISLILCCASPLMVTAATVVNSFSVTTKNNVIIDINLSQSVHYHSFTLSNPQRLVIDLNDTQPIHATLPDLSTTPWIKQIRIAPRSQESQRIAIEFTEDIKHTVTLLPPSSDNANWRLHLDVQPASTTQANNTSKNKTATTPIKSLPTTVKTADAHSANTRCIKIVIDPGHGGHDPGAISAHGTKEKNVTLAISKYLADLINHSPGMCAYLTRNDDQFISLRGRINFARKQSADLFVAIHADMFKNQTARGATVFALSQRGATSEAARWVAHNENVDDFLEVGESNSNDKDLQSILMDISQNETINRSLILGKYVLVNLDNVTKVHHTIVEQAGFVVLKSPDIPSILVETGFLSNAYEEQELAQSSYQKKIALAIYRGIMEYAQEYSQPLRNNKGKS